MARINAVIVVAALAAMPAGALGADGGGLEAPVAPAPQQPLLQDQPQEAPAPAPEQGPPSEAESRIGPRDLLLVGGAIAALIGGIWYVIARDARRATAGRLRAQAAGGEGAGGSATRAARRTRRLSAAERRRRKRGRAN